MSKKQTTKQKYWYITTIKVCVICGKERKMRERVYEKPANEERLDIIDTACEKHFF